MALTNTQVTQIADSIAKAISDFQSGFVAGTSTTASNINAGVGGTGASATVGRVLAYAGVPDLADELSLLSPISTVANQVAAYMAGIRGLNPFYVQFFPFLDKLDSALGGLNAFLTAGSLQVNAYFAAAFNYYQQQAIALGYRSPATVPTALSAANFFPNAAVDDLWDITASGATTFSTNQVGTSVDTSGAGGGVGQIYIYKVNATNAIGGATITVTYTKADGTSGSANYSTTSGVPLASGSLAAGYAVTGAIGKAITAVTGSGMTSGEQYRFGIQLVRAPAY